MTENNTYHWKELSLNKKYLNANTGVYSPIDVKDCDLTSILPFFEDAFLNLNFIKEYQFFTISISAKNLIDSLLEIHKISNLNPSFYLLSAIFQKEYINKYELNPNMAEPLLSDFQNERKDLETLLNVLFIKLSKGNDVIKAISFKTEKAITINNFFVLNDMLDAMIKCYNLNLENFEIRKQELIEDTNSNKLKLLDEYQKWGLVKGLYNFISKDKTNSGSTLNEHIRFVGSFLQISQIPINKTQFEVSISNGVNSIMSTEDLKYLNLFLKRPKALFIK